MIRLRFFNLQPPSSVEVSAQGFLFDADCVRRLPTAEMVARHGNNLWSIGNERYLRLEVMQPVECHFRGAGGETVEKHGPFGRVSAVDGVVIVDDQPIAMLRPKGWACLIDERVWPEFALVPKAPEQ